MTGMTFNEQVRKAQDIWDRLYVHHQRVRQIAADLEQSPQSIYAFMARRDWKLPVPEADRLREPPPRPSKDDNHDTL